MNALSRSLIGFASLALIATLFVPLWQIRLWAPQYPEGLVMRIWHNKLSGDVDIINGLNHYIGMRHIEASMFPEFKVIGGLLILLALIGIWAAYSGKRKALVTFAVSCLLLGVAALIDFYRWGYDYGHNLDPKAAIHVPGMAYQPPVLGYKNLLNFLAYSGPDIGGWIMIGAGAIAVGLLAWGIFQDRRALRATKVLGLLGVVVLMGACSPEPRPLNYGKDACHFCKMTLSDKRYGAEIVTQKGKVYVFDDLNCMVGFEAKGEVPSAQIALRLAARFDVPQTLIPVENAVFLHAAALKSPMRADVAAFGAQPTAQEIQKQYGSGEIMHWADVVKLLQ
ncbi:MAG: nitrous oxide reductase accessory protein NosL [Saprospiraceae bacterium]|nr:nitrous oxide reductase accessory protein NosL [Saprospiraceae bacterium]